MSRLGRGLIVGVITAIVAFAVVWIITAIRGASLVDAISQPGFWLVEGAAVVISVLVVVSESDKSDRASSPFVRVATHAVWAVLAAVVIGVLLAIATNTAVWDLLTSLRFLIPAGIAVIVAVFEAWPDDTSVEA